MARARHGAAAIEAVMSIIRLAIAMTVLALARPARAHPLDLGYVRIEAAGDRVAVQLDLDVNAAAILLDVDAAALDAATVGARASALARASYARAPITTAAGPCAWTGAVAALAGRTVSLTDTALCSGPGPRRWAFPIVTEGRVSARFQLMVKETVAGSERLTLVDKTTHELELELGAATDTPARSTVGFTDFVWSGVEHIGVAPDQWQTDRGGLKLPDGIDHILFLIALMLGGGTLLQLVGIATGFTLGHSITLALAALDVVRPPAQVIEPLIALTIALAAVEAFTGKFKQHRWKIATGFGLVHGFAFATALTHLELTTRGKVTALFGYNIGVELGQVVVVLVVAPLVLFAHRRPRIGDVVTRIAATAIFACGVYWFFARLG
jgi:hypothetical protein